MNKKAIIYARTACKSQNGDQAEIKRQIQACLALAKKSGLTVVKTVADEGVTELKDSEKRLLNLLRLCQKKRAKTLITYDIERLSRDFAYIIRFLFHLQSKGVDLLTVLSDEDWIRESFAKYYKEALSRAIKKGIAEAKRKKNLTDNHE
jgi:DNA invertase Pin-like site-specific DNA recombinase